jgi:SAM-dependent methyltransferase
MQRNLLASLRCPFTGSAFDMTSVLREQDSTIEFGVLTSEAGQFPIIAGVVRLLADDLQTPLVSLLQERRFDDALRTALEVPFLSRRGATAHALWRRAARSAHLGLSANAIGPGKRRLYQLVTQRNVTFARLVADARAEGWTNWQTHRFSMPTFLPVYALAHLARGSNRILDFGCGLAHSAFLMTRLAPRAEMVCADYSFTSLFLGKRFLVPGAECVCLDGDYPMPFVDAHFDLVFSTDALQYIEPKIGLAREFARVLSEEGVISLAHLHNRLSPGRAPAGKTLTPKGYYGLFGGMVRRLYPEDSVVADYVSEGALHLEREWTMGDLTNARQGLSLVAAHTDSIFQTLTGLLDTYIDAMQQPNLNPAYRARPASGTLAIERHIGAPFVVERTIQGCEVLPRQSHVDMKSLDSAEILSSRDVDRTAIRELVRRFLVLDMPESYV